MAACGACVRMCVHGEISVTLPHHRGLLPEEGPEEGDAEGGAPW